MTDIAHCPHCDSDNITSVCDAGQRTWHYVCLNCGHVTPDRPNIAALADDVIWRPLCSANPVGRP